MRRPRTAVAVTVATVLASAAPAASAPAAPAVAAEARDVALITDGLRVSVVDRATDTKVGSIGGFSNAVGIAVLADRHRAYVANSLGNSVAVLDTTTARITTTITGVTSPGMVLADRTGTHVYVATGPNLAVIDPAAATVTATITSCPTPTSLAVSPDGATLYVGDDVTSGTAPRPLVSVVDTATRTVRTVCGGPRTVAWCSRTAAWRWPRMVRTSTRRIRRTASSG